MESQGPDKKSKVSRVTLIDYVRIALPCILAGGVLGGIIGDSLRVTENGIRVGIILGGIVAYILLRLKKARSSN